MLNLVYIDRKKTLKSQPAITIKIHAVGLIYNYFFKLMLQSLAISGNLFICTFIAHNYI